MVPYLEVQQGVITTIKQDIPEVALSPKDWARAATKRWLILFLQAAGPIS